MKHLINWVEIPVTDMDRACRFYGPVMAVELQRTEMGGSTCAIFPTEDRFNVSTRGACQRSGPCPREQRHPHLS
jgi:predicted enzyme related to lactoylglutathione lyase